MSLDSLGSCRICNPQLSPNSKRKVGLFMEDELGMKRGGGMY